MLRLSKLVVSLIAVSVLTPVAAQAIIYVDDDAPAGGDGTTWNTAYTHLQDAMADAAGSAFTVEIRVAQGTYKPDLAEGGSVTPGDRYATFTLLNQAELYAGYAGLGAPDPDLRDVGNHVSILSGDLAGDDGPDFANYGENSHHVVTGSGTSTHAVIDGFTITAGYADVGSSPNRHGAGMHNINANCRVRNCNFVANATNAYAGHGAGMHNSGGAPEVTDCTFYGNRTLYGYSGSGGGMYNTNNDATILRCTFVGNSAYEGGGVHNYRGTPTIQDCDFRDNSSGTGGGLRNNYSDAWIINCRFLGNHSTGVGGAVHNSYEHPKFVNCVMIGNTAFYSGGASYTYLGDPTFTNCVIAYNTSTLYPAGGIYNSRSEALITNSILWGNKGIAGATSEAQMYVPEGFYSSDPIVNHTCIQGGWSGLGGTGIITDAPSFLREPYDGGDGWGVGGNDDFGDVHLTAISPCLDVGDNDADTDQITGGLQLLPATDLDGNPRIVDDPVAPPVGPPAVVDHGVFEYQADCNTNGITDSLDLQAGTSLDCNSNGVPDECEAQDDCNNNSIQDICDLAYGTAADCNRNDVLDTCDIVGGASLDDNGNGVPDACERNLTGYWQVDISLDTGCYIIDEYLTERHFMRFDESNQPTEAWIQVGVQYLKLNYPSTDGPSFHRLRQNAMHTANTDRAFTLSEFTPHAGVWHTVETVAITDDDEIDLNTHEGSEQGLTLLGGTMDTAGTTMMGTWQFREAYETLCGPFTATKLPGLPPALPSIVDLEAVSLSLSTTELARPGWVDIVQREYRVRSSFLEGDVKLHYLLSTDDVADAGDLLIGTETISAGPDTLLGLHAGPGPSLWIPECMTPADSYYVIAVIDPEGIVNETDELNNAWSLPVTVTPPRLMADFDCDDDVDLEDYEVFEVCLWFSGPDVQPPFDECLEIFDFDHDQDVDLEDIGAFLEAFTG